MAYRRTHGVDTAIVRIFNTHGPRMRPDDGRAVPTFASQALRGEPITVAGDGSQTRSIIYVDDLVEGSCACCAPTSPARSTSATRTRCPCWSSPDRSAARPAASSEIVFVARPEDDPSVRQPDITLARTALGWEPRVGYEEGLERTMAWFRSHPAVGHRLITLG